MNFKIFLVIYLQLIYTSLANLKLTAQDIILPTKVKSKYVDSMKYDKRVVNDSAPFNLTFEFQAKYNLYEKDVDYFFNGELMDKNRPDIKRGTDERHGRKLFFLTFYKFTEKTAGQYLLLVKTINGSEINATANIFSPPFIHEFTESKRSTEGGRIDALCKYTAYPMEITELDWKAVSPNQKMNYRLTKSKNNSEFKDIIAWDFLEKQDAGYYQCDVKNKFGNDTALMQLRVKDKLAPLWPFIGIVIEIVILLLIIIFYERQKSSKKAADQDSNPTRQSLLAGTKNSEANEGLHHRNPVN